MSGRPVPGGAWESPQLSRLDVWQRRVDRLIRRWNRAYAFTGMGDSDGRRCAQVDALTEAYDTAADAWHDWCMHRARALWQLKGVW